MKPLGFGDRVRVAPRERWGGDAASPDEVCAADVLALDAAPEWEGCVSVSDAASLSSDLVVLSVVDGRALVTWEDLADDAHGVPMPSVDAWSVPAFVLERVPAPDVNDPGFATAPARYTAHGRETIDRMRDLARESFADRNEADGAFAFFCRATALKYDDRAGLKGPADTDREKAAWYRQMADHVDGLGDDPRQGRAGFVPYTEGGKLAAVALGEVSGG